MTANPLRLVELLYRGALDSIASARRCLKTGDISGRSRAITKAMEIVTELSRSLNREAAGALGENLSAIYIYSLDLLMEANLKQLDPPLAEAEGLLGTLADAWKDCSDAVNPVVSNKAMEMTEEYQPVSCAY